MFLTLVDPEMKILTQFACKRASKENPTGKRMVSSNSSSLQLNTPAWMSAVGSTKSAQGRKEGRKGVSVRLLQPPARRTDGWKRTVGWTRTLEPTG
jgi:hypothetical protein